MFVWPHRKFIEFNSLTSSETQRLVCSKKFFDGHGHWSGQKCKI